MPPVPALLTSCPPVDTPAALLEPAFSTMASPVPAAVTALASVRLDAAAVVSTAALPVTLMPVTPATAPTVSAPACA